MTYYRSEMSAEAQASATCQLLEETRTQVGLLEGKLNILNRTVRSLPQVAGPTASQEVRNGDFGHSWNTHEEATALTDDTAFECWKIFTHDAPFVTQELLQQAVYLGNLVAASNALPDVGRSDTPAADPDWSRSNGYARLGSTKSIDFPLPENHAFPGRRIYLSVIMARADSDVVIPGRFAAGIWDNTKTARDFLQATPFTINAGTVGVPAGTISRDYLIVGRTDFGRTVSSQLVTVANAPDDTSFISGQVYVHLSWTPIRGVINWDIYRDTGGVFVLLAQESTITDYFDQGSSLRVVDGYPDTTATNQSAYAETRAGELDSMPVDGVSSEWVQYDLAIQVPPTWDATGVETGMIWLRLFFTEALGTARGAHIDLVMLSLQAGSFAYHPQDQGQQDPIARPNGSSQGGAGTGGGTFVPPTPGGGGGERCLAPSMLIQMADPLGGVTWIMAGALLRAGARPGYHVITRENGQRCYNEIETVSEGWTEGLLTLEVAEGRLLCSPSEPVIQNLHDRTGKRADTFRKGDPVMVEDDRGSLRVVPLLRAPVVGAPSRTVKITLKGVDNRRKVFIARAPGSRVAFAVHNVKPEGL